MAFSLREYVDNRRKDQEDDSAASQENKPFSLSNYISQRRMQGSFQKQNESYNNWLGSVGSLSNRISQEYNSRLGSYQNPEELKTYRNKTGYELGDMLNQAYLSRDYYTKYKDAYDETYGAGTADKLISSLTKGIDGLNEIKNILDSEYDYWNQWESEDDYNDWQKQMTKQEEALKEREELSSWDIGAAEQQLSDIQAQLRNAQTEYNTAALRDQGGMGRFAPSSLLDKAGSLFQLPGAGRSGNLNGLDGQTGNSSLGDGVSLPDGTKLPDWYTNAAQPEDGESLRLEDIGPFDAPSANVDDLDEYREDLQKQADELARKINLAKDVQTSNRYYALMDEPDFEELSVPRESGWDGRVPRLGESSEDDRYDYINDTNGYRQWKRSEIMLGTASDRYEEYDMLTEDEIGIYNYLDAKQGREAADEFLSFMMPELEQRRFSAYQGKMGELSKQHPVGMTLVSLLGKIPSGVESAADLIGQNINQAFTGEPVNYFSKAQQNSAGMDTIRSTVGQQLEENTNWTIGGRNIASFLYGTGMSGLDSLAASFLGGPGVGGALLATGAASSTARDIASRGGSDSQALVGGVAAGIFEALFERFSIGNLQALKKTSVGGIKDLVKNIAKSAGVNASEEAATEMANIVFDTIAMGDVSNWERSIKAYMEEGMSESEAKSRTVQDMFGQVIEAGAGGALMGVGFGGIGSGVGWLSNRKGNRAEIAAVSSPSDSSLSEQNQTGAALQEAPLPPALQEAMTSAAETGSVSNSMAERILGDPEAVRTLSETAGLEISQDMKISMQRNAVKDAVSVLSSRSGETLRTNNQVARAAEKSAPMAAESVSARRTQSGAADRLSSSAYASHINSQIQRGSALGDSGKKAFQLSIRANEEGVAADPVSFYKGFMDYYNAGVNGEKLNRVQSPAAGSLDSAQQFAAYSAGQNDAAASLAAEKTSGGVVNTRGALPQAESQLLDRLAKSVGVKIEIVDSIDAPEGQGEVNGIYLPEQNTIRLSRSGDGQLAVVAAHEITHRIQELSPEAYRAYRDFAVDYLSQSYAKNHPGAASDAVITAQAERYAKAGVKLTAEQSMDELAADFTRVLINDANLFGEFARENRTTAQKVLDALKNFIAKVKSLFKGDKSAQDAAAKTAYGADIQTLERAASLWNEALRAAGKAKSLEGQKNSALQGGEAKFSIKYDKDNRPYVVIEEDILASVPKKDWVKTVKNNLREKFPNGVIVGSNVIKINLQSRSEMTFSRYTQKLMSTQPQLYADKLRATNNADEILKASQDYVNEGLHHPRKDKIQDFARGTVLLRIGSSDYSSDVVVAMQKNGDMLLYDLLNLQKTRIIGKNEQKKSDTEFAAQPHGAGRAVDSSTPTQNAAPVSDTISIPQLDEKSNTKFPLKDQSPEARNSLKGGYELMMEALAEENGRIAPGESPARDVKVPKKTVHGKTSQTARTALEASVTTDEGAEALAKEIVEGGFSYAPVSDKDAADRARALIEDKGYQGALLDWTKDIAETHGVSKDVVALGFQLYNGAISSGDAKTAVRILTELSARVREGAQAVQAVRMLKQLSPDHQLYAITRSVQSLQEEISRRYGKGKVEIKVDETLAHEYLTADNDAARDRARKALYRDVAAQIPSTLEDKWNAWRYLSMLANPRTHVRNIVGNLGFVPVRTLKNLFATGMEAAGERISGGRMERTKALVGRTGEDGALRKAAAADYDNVVDAIQSAGKYNEQSEVERSRTIFKNNGSWGAKAGSPAAAKAARKGADKLMTALDAAAKGNSWLLDMEDQWFSKPAYASALAGWLKAHDMTAADFTTLETGTLDAARAYAIKEAQKATYRDANVFSDLVSGIGRRLRNDPSLLKRTAGRVVEGVQPFRRTPANILVRGVEYSPLGLLNGIKELVWDVRKGNKTAAQAIDALAAGLSGTGLMLLGMLLAKHGLITGGEDDDEKQAAFDELRGRQNYALEIGGVSVTLDWLAPEALPLFVGVELANLSEIADEDGEARGWTTSALLEAASRISDPMLEMSMLSSLQDLIDSVTYADSKMVGVIASAITSYIGQAIPTLFGQIERTTEEIRYSTYTDKNNEWLPADAQYFLGQSMNKLPGEYGQIPYIDAWGREESTGSALERGINNFLNPAYVSKDSSTEFDDELQRLYGEGYDGVYPRRASSSVTSRGKTRHLTAEEYLEFARTKGRTQYETVKEITSSDWYAKFGDAEKADAIELAYDYAQAAGKKAAVGIEPDGWEAKAEKAKALGVSVAAFIRLKIETGGAASIKDKNGETIPNSKSLLVMESIYSIPGLSDTQREYLFECFDVGKSVRHYNKAAVAEHLQKMRRQ